MVGVPEPNIGRLAYLNCRYGIPPQHGATPVEPLIEIGVSLYRTAMQAQARVRGTVYDYLYNNATEANRTVAGQHAVLLTGGVGPGYDVPLLVLAAGQRTVAVSVATRAGTAATRWKAMVALTVLALTRTAELRPRGRCCQSWLATTITSRTTAVARMTAAVRMARGLRIVHIG